ncbi:MAG: hypothetical protein ABIO44_09665 [Saprospiraceae bacterium]
MSENKIMSSYLEKRALYPRLIDISPLEDVSMILIIPCYHEENPILALESLMKTTSISSSIEIILILNYPYKYAKLERDFHIKQHHEILNWIDNNKREKISIHCPSPIELESNHTGVGLARKIGMDEAARRYNFLNKTDGIIINFDADCLCHQDYFMEIEKYFKLEKSKSCIGIGFVHVIDELNINESKAIIDYELHLRYYIQAQKQINYPFAFHILGSCFAVRAVSYCEQGGMNQRQAGEDFYFMHKFSVINELDEIKKVLVYPSARVSDRVPFGTGKAISQYLETGFQKTYALDSILLFGQLIKCIGSFYTYTEAEIITQLNHIHPGLAHYFISEGFLTEIKLCKKNCKHTNSFHKRLLRWLNPFRLMKYLHEMREHGFSDQEVSIEARKLLTLMNEDVTSDSSNLSLLKRYRGMI